MAVIEENPVTIEIPEEAVIVDEINGSFQFEILVKSTEAYAGAEFGVICSEGTEITFMKSK